MLPDVEYTEVIGFSHGEAFCRTYGCAQSAETAFTHVNVKLRGINSFWGAIRGSPDFFGGPDGLNGDAIHGANLDTFVTNYAIIDFIMKFVAAGVGYRKGDVWILNGGNPFGLIEVGFVLDEDRLLATSGFYYMAKRKP